METWVWIIIGCLAGSLVLGVLICIFLKFKNQVLLQELKEGEAFCYVAQVKKSSRGIFGKSKLVTQLIFTKSILSSKQIADLYNFYYSENVSEKQQANIKQCFKNLKAKGIEVPVLEDEEEDEYYDEEDDEKEQKEDHLDELDKEKGAHSGHLLKKQQHHYLKNHSTSNID